MNPQAIKVFNFLRGAIRGSYGTEDFRSLKFLVNGTSEVGQHLLSCLCLDGLDIKFQDPSMRNYGKSFSACRNISYYDGGKTDVVIDFITGFIKVKDHVFPIQEIEDKNSYTQGIHAFYRL